MPDCLTEKDVAHAQRAPHLFGFLIMPSYLQQNENRYKRLFCMAIACLRSLTSSLCKIAWICTRTVPEEI